MTEHDMTRTLWGHNVEITTWDRENRICEGVCWMTPSPKDGDVLIINGKRGPIRLLLRDVEWVLSTDDMFRFKADPC